MGTIIVVIVGVVVLVVGLGGYVTYQIYRAYQPSGSTTVTTGPAFLQISGSSLKETVPVSSDSTVQMSCNYCTITLQLGSPSVTIDLQISGNYNQVTVTGGRTGIFVSGNYNTVNAQGTTVLSVQNSGVGNTIQR
jgi:hypothetical protein